MRAARSSCGGGVVIEREGEIGQQQIGHRPMHGIERVWKISWSMQSDNEVRKNGHLTCATMAEMEMWTPLPPSFVCAGTVVPQCCARPDTAFFCAAAHFFHLRHKKTCRHTFSCLIRMALNNTLLHPNPPRVNLARMIYSSLTDLLRRRKSPGLTNPFALLVPRQHVGTTTCKVD